MSDSRSVESIDRDLQLISARRSKARVQISQLKQAIRNDGRSLNRLLEERFAATLPQVPESPAALQVEAG